VTASLIAPFCPSKIRFVASALNFASPPANSEIGADAIPKFAGLNECCDKAPSLI